MTTDKTELSADLAIAASVCGNSHSLPILANVAIRSDGKSLNLTATDLDITITCAVPANIQTEGAVTLPGKKIFGIVRELVVAEVEIEVDEKSVASVRSGASFFKINGLPADDYPPMPVFKQLKTVNLPQEKLKVMLKRTSFAVSSDETRYVLNGIFFSLKEHKVTLVATDGRRMALMEDSPPGSSLIRLPLLWIQSSAAA
jgi:DNA polymerase-3 subunit beta